VHGTKEIIKLAKEIVNLKVGFKLLKWGYYQAIMFLNN